MKLAKQLMEEEDDDDEGDNDDVSSAVNNDENLEKIDADDDDDDNNNLDEENSDSHGVDNMVTDQNENPTETSAISPIPGSSSIVAKPESTSSLKRETQV